MALTYEPISTNTLGSNTATVTFSSIPSTYTDLIVIINYRSANTSAGSVRCTVNSVTSGYSGTYVGSSTVVYSGKDTGNAYFRPLFLPSSNSPFGIGIIQFQNYSNTSVNKTVISRYGSPNNETVAYASLIQTTNAISTIAFSTDTTGYASGSTFTLYGIKAA